MTRLDRLTAILIHLQTKRVVRAQKLASRFGVSLRTVYRDLRSLETAGVPIGADAGVGYFLTDYHLPPVMFTNAEASSLVFGAKLVETLGDASVQTAFETDIQLSIPGPTFGALPTLNQCIMSAMTITSTVDINAPAAVVWDVLINPEQTQKYMFGCEALSDWTPGSPLLWQGVWEGQKMVFVKGTVVAVSPNTLLSYTTFDPNSTLPDIPENYTTVTYKLTESNNQTQLIVTQGDFAHVADGERRYREASNNGEGWNPILVQIKAISEVNT